MDSSIAALERLSKFVLKYEPNLAFSLLEVGAVPVENREEPFYKLLDYFPKSKMHAFELDESLCLELNENSRRNITYYSTAVGDKNEERPLYEANNPLCSSLYKPDDELLSNYNGLEMAMLKDEHTVTTVGLDTFSQKHKISSIDFMKLDIQGAELDVFRGGTKSLCNTLVIVSEVGFIPLYVDQPLFGDVCNFLIDKNLMFHKFLDLAGRSIKPAIIDNDVNNATQLMWADAVFIKKLNKLEALSPKRLLKLSVLAYVYKSPDLTYRCMQIYDARKNTNLSQEYLGLGT